MADAAILLGKTGDDPRRIRQSIQHHENVLLPLALVAQRAGTTQFAYTEGGVVPFLRQSAVTAQGLDLHDLSRRHCDTCLL